jgi:WD40 repeat protein
VREWLDALYGYDFFICYRHLGAGEYAAALRRRLAAGKPALTAFLDRMPDGFVAGQPLDQETARAARGSTALIVLCDRTAFHDDSLYMPAEVGFFDAARKLIVPVDLDGSLRGARRDDDMRRALPGSDDARDMLETLLRRITVEEVGVLPPEPSDLVVEKLRGSLVSIRRSSRRARFFAAAAAGFLVLALLAAAAAAVATLARQREAAARKASDARAYAAGVNAGDFEQAAGEFAALRGRLRAMPVSPTGWERRYLERLADRSARVICRHGDRVTGVAFDADGSRVVSIAADGSVCVSAPEGRPLGAFSSPAAPLSLAHARASGRYAVGLARGGILVGDSGVLAPPTPVPTTTTASVIGMALSSDGRELFSSDEDGLVLRWNLGAMPPTSQIVWQGSDAASVALDPAGENLYLVTFGGRLVRVRLRDGATVYDEKRHADVIGGLSVLGGGASVAVADFQGWLALYDADDAERQGGFRAVRESEVGIVSLRTLAARPDQTWVATVAKDGLVKTWDFGPEPRPLLTLPGHEGSADCVAVHPREPLLISGGSDGTVRLWTLRPHEQPVRRLKVAEEDADVVAAHPSDGRFLVGSSDALELHAARGDETPRRVTVDGGVVAIAFAPGGGEFVTASESGELTRWNYPALVRGVSAATAQPLEAGERRATHVAYSADGAQLFVGTGGGLVGDFYDLQARDPRTLSTTRTLSSGHKAVESIDVGGSSLAAVTGDTLRVWRAGTPVTTLPALPAAPVVVRFDGAGVRLAVALANRQVGIIDVKTGALVALLAARHAEPVRGLDFNADGTRLITSAEDGLVKVWWVDEQLELLTLRGHNGAVVHTVRFLPGGDTILSADAYGTVTLWNVGHTMADEPGPVVSPGGISGTVTAPGQAR